MKPNAAAMPGGQKQRNPGSRADPLGSNTEIGRKLKHYYDGLVSDEVPDRFADLLKQLEESESDSDRRDGE